jgi:outer membrane biosynthesis protein TonB
MRNYGVALTLSLVFHAFVITGMPNIILRKTNNLGEKKETQPLREIKMMPQDITKIKKEPSRRDSGADPEPLPYIENIMTKLIKNDNLTDLTKPQILEKPIKEITISEISPANQSLKNNPAYMDYYRLIRERIRANAYANYNYNKKGEVSLTFLIFHDGSLHDVSLNPESIEDATLRKIAIKSVKESAPFPSFPAELQKYSKLQFKIPIYFKNN